MDWISVEALQYSAWFLSMVEFVLALYILLLNPWHTANRHVSGLLLLFTVNTIGLSTTLNRAEPLELGMILVAITTPAVEPALLIVTAALLKPAWLPRLMGSTEVGGMAGADHRPGSDTSPTHKVGKRERGRDGWRSLWWIVYGLSLLPVVLTLIDYMAGTGLWYTPLVAGGEGTGYISMQEVTQGSLAPILRPLLLWFMGLAPALLILYLIVRDREMAPATKRLAWILLAVQILAIAVQMGLRGLLGGPLAALLTTTTFVLAYAYAAFRQIISERRVQRGRLQTRVTALVLAISVPLLVGVVIFVTARITTLMQETSDEQLQAANRALAANTEIWLDLNVRALQQMAALPQIVSMEAEQQQPILEGMVEVYPYLTLVSTIDLYGANLARSDGLPPGNYRREYWHIGARNGVPVTYDVVPDELSGRPLLVMAVPIRRASGTIVGVAMFASTLDVIGEEVQATTVGESGFAYLVDGRNRVVAHPDPVYAAEMRDLNYYMPVFELRGGMHGFVNFTDEQGSWRAYVDELENGWGVIVQQPLQDLQSPVRNLQTISWVTISLGTLTLLTLVGLTIRQALRPIDVLTETATAIAAGDLDRTAPIESEDEIGTLARTFNSMTQQLRSLIGNLERQVLERTQALAQRSVYLEATAEVGRAATSILDRERLSHQVVELIRDRFDLYYVGLFLVDDFGEWAVLHAGTGEAGQIMIERGHRIKVGEGMIGWAVIHGEARVAELAEQDTVRLATPELPLTRSEVALPLRSRDRVLGALSVQHTEANAFDLDTIAVLQTMADQVAVALDNALLFAESREALESARRAYGEVSRRTWSDLIRSHPDWGYRYSQRKVSPVSDALRKDLLEAETSGEIIVHNPTGRTGPGATPQEDGMPALAIPLKVRDEVVGVLGFRKRAEDGAWTSDETLLLETFVSRLEVALEGARLYQDTQRRAARDRLLADIVGRIRETLDVETVLRTAAQEVRQALDLPEVAVRLRQVESFAPGIEPSDDGQEGVDGWDVELG